MIVNRHGAVEHAILHPLDRTDDGRPVAFFQGFHIKAQNPRLARQLRTHLFSAGVVARDQQGRQHGRAGLGKCKAVFPADGSLLAVLRKRAQQNDRKRCNHRCCSKQECCFEGEAGANGINEIHWQDLQLWRPRAARPQKPYPQTRFRGVNPVRPTRPDRAAGFVPARRNGK